MRKNIILLNLIDRKVGQMKLLEELRFCIMALESLKMCYLEKLLYDENEDKIFKGLIAGQYIAYACCHSILSDLADKHEKREDI